MEARACALTTAALIASMTHGYAQADISQRHERRYVRKFRKLADDPSRVTLRDGMGRVALRPAADEDVP